MKKELKYYLHLYLGCQFVMKIDNPNSEHHGQFTAPMYFGSDVLHAALCKGDYKIDPILILRPLSSMTEEDIDLGDFIPEFAVLVQRFTAGYCVELDSVQDDGYCLTIYPDGSMYCICKDNNENYPYKGGELFNQLLRKGFDLFNLIPDGLAVNAETLK